LGLFRKRNKGSSDECPHNLEYGVCEICPVLGGWDPSHIIKTEPIKKSFEPDLIQLLQDFYSDMSSIHNGQVPVWKSFFAAAKKLESEWENLISEYGECAAFSSEVMDSGDLISVEWIFKDSDFINGIIKLISVDNHFACWLLTGEYNNCLDSKNLAEILTRLVSSEEAGYCEECIYGDWWDQPITYVAAHVNSDSKTLEKIYKQNKENLEILCALAQNQNTPILILSELSLVDEFVEYSDEQLCPFFDSKDPDCFKISNQAKKTISKIT